MLWIVSFFFHFLNMQQRLPSIQSMLSSIKLDDKLAFPINYHPKPITTAPLKPLEPYLTTTTQIMFTHRPPRNLHSRSFSDYTHPYPTLTPPHCTQLAPIKHHRRSMSTNTLPIEDNKSDKYSCSYCQKGFSRPSSLRIHTYSHTGERPFACPQQGCNRKFSVQSNMRRHLRVHKVGGKRVPVQQKPLAAKPST